MVPDQILPAHARAEICMHSIVFWHEKFSLLKLSLREMRADSVFEPFFDVLALFFLLSAIDKSLLSPHEYWCDIC